MEEKEFTRDEVACMVGIMGIVIIVLGIACVTMGSVLLYQVLT